MRTLVFALAAGMCVFGATLQPADVKIAGALDYGQTSDPIDYTGTPRYAALVFNGNGGDQIEVDVKGGTGKAAVSITDGSLKELTSGTGHISFTLPKNGPDLETFYIVFRDPDGKAAQYTVVLAKPGKSSARLHYFEAVKPGFRVCLACATSSSVG